MKGGDIMNATGTQLAVIGIAIFADYITGVAKACYQHDYKSCVMREGLYHKAAEIFAVALMYFLEIGLPTIGVTINFPFVSSVTVYIVIMEISSIIENIGEINPELVGPLGNVFEKIKDASTKGDNK